MVTITFSRRMLAAVVGGIAIVSLLAISLTFWAGLNTHRARAASGPANYLPSNSNIHASSARYLAQFFLHDHLNDTLKIRQGTGKAGATASPKGPLFMAPGGALSFNSDSTVLTQNEETYAIDPTTTGSQTGMIGVGGFNDFRGFFFSNVTTSGYAVSKNVSCTAGTCAQLLKDGWVPGVTDPLCTDGSVLMASGDPALAVNAAGTFFFASLALPTPSSGCANSNGDNGVMVSVSNTANLENGSFACNDALTTNSCWTSTLIHENSQSGCSSFSSPCSFDDKEWITVDPVSGIPTVAWDYQDELAGIQYVVDSTCNTTATSCSAPAKASAAPASCPSVNPCDSTFAPYLAIWHNPVSNANNVVMSYEQFEQVSPFNLDLHLADLTTHTDQIFLSLPPYEVVDGLSGTQFRITTQVKIAADYRAVASPHIYVTWDQCKPAGTNGQGANYFFGFFVNNIASCAESVVHVQDFTSATGAGTGISVLGGFNQFFPSLAVDEVGATAGHVLLGYYSSQGDGTGASALIRPYAAFSTGGASPSAFATNTFQSVLTANFRYTADPLLQVGLVGPLMGDYMQVATANGGLFLHFNGTYEQKTGPTIFGTVPVNQSDNYLCYIQPSTGIATSGVCSSQ